MNILIDIFKQLSITFGVILISLEIGKRIISFFNIRMLNKFETMLFSIGLGIVSIIYAMILAGFLRMYYGWIFKGVFYLLLLTIIVLYVKKTPFRYPTLNLLNRKLTFEHIALFFIVSIAILYTLPNSLLPEIYEDALRAHLHIPKLYIQNHGIYNIVRRYSNFSPSIQMLYTLGLLLNGQIVAKLINFTLGILTLMAISSFCRRYFNAKIGIIAAFIFYSTPLVIFSSITANSDMGVTFFLFLSLYSLFLWIEYKNTNLLVMSAVFYGIALGSKYNVLYGLIPIFLFIAINSGKGIKKIVKNEFLFLSIMLMFISIWWIKAYLYTGNPVFPFFNKIFKSKLWPQDFNDWLNFYSYGKGISLKNLLTLPVDVTFRANLYGQHGVGFFYLFLIPIGIFFSYLKKKSSFIIKYLLLFIGFYFSLWALTAQISRYLMPMLSVSCIIAAFGVYNLGQFIRGKPHILFKIALISSFILSIPIAGNHFKINLYNLAKAFKDKEKYLSEKIPEYPMIQYVNRNLKTNDNILEIKGRESFYYYNCNMIGAYEYPFVRIIYDYISKEDLDILIKNLKEKRINYVIVNLDDIWVKKAMSSAECPLVRIKKEELFALNEYYKLYKIDYNNLF